MIYTLGIVVGVLWNLGLCFLPDRSADAPTG
jgi:hypothetical protein